MVGRIVVVGVWYLREKGVVVVVGECLWHC